MDDGIVVYGTYDVGTTFGSRIYGLEVGISVEM